VAGKNRQAFDSPSSAARLYLRIFLEKPASYSYQNKRSLQENCPKMYGICPSNKYLITKNINGIFSVLSGVPQICWTKERNYKIYP